MIGIHHRSTEIEPLVLSFIFSTRHANLQSGQNRVCSITVLSIIGPAMSNKMNYMALNTGGTPPGTAFPAPVQVSADIADV